MHVIFQQRTIQQALIAPLAIGGLLLTAACADDEGPEDTPESPEGAETAENDPADAEDEVAAEDTDGSDQTSSDDVFTMEDLEENDSPESCWAAMDGTVYDLTEWIDQHPGGAARIERLCGTDATEAFDGQHGGQDGPEDQLSEFEIGTLEN